MMTNDNLDQNLDEQLRETVTKQRQHDDHRQETMRGRAEEELETPNHSNMGETIREIVTEQRQYTEHLQDTTHTRAAADVGTEGAPIRTHISE